jgi:D-glycero-alpha-D-manno-heptose 1-phosphate guanylyltransferase
MIRTAVILAGGFGTRLQTVVKDLPKPLAPVHGQPFLNYLLGYLHASGFNSIVLSVGYLSEKIREIYGTSWLGMQIEYALENEPLGTGGGIRLAMEKVHETECLVLNGDSFFDIDLPRFYGLHLARHADISLALRQVDDSSRYGTVITGADDRVNSFREKNGLPESGSINAGVYILNRKIFLERTPAEKNFSIEKDFFEPNVESLKIFGFKFTDYFIDIGIPDDYAKAQNDFKGFKY